MELEPACVEVADLRIDEGRIVARGPNLEASPGDEVIELRERWLLAGLVNVHHHLHAALGRGLRALHDATVGSAFVEGLEKGLWRLEQALDLDAVQASAMVGGLDALCSGTTTVFAQHASPRHIEGSLTRLARGLNEVGLRGVLSYEVTDRFGAVGREKGLEESVAFAKKARGRFRGRIGAHASFTLSLDALQGLADAVKAAGVGVHLQLAEDPSDERLSFERYGSVPVARLSEAGLLSPQSIVAHVLHLSWPELAQVIGTGAWLAHCPRANMRQMRGHAPSGKFGARATLGTGTFPPDVLAEAQVAALRSYEAEQPIDVLRYLANGQRLASEAFGLPLGPLREGAAADIVVMDYRPPTPLTVESLPGHLVEGLGARCVESVMVDGVWRLWGRRPLSVAVDVVGRLAQDAGAGVRARMAELEASGPVGGKPS